MKTRVFLSVLLAIGLFACCNAQTVADSVIYFDEPPQYKKGEKGPVILTFDYPREALDNDIEGIVFVLFYIDIDGSVVDPKVIKSSGSDILDNAVIAYLLNMPKWAKPAYLKGQPVKAKLGMPFKFSLD